MTKFRTLSAVVLMTVTPWFAMAADSHGDHAHEQKAGASHSDDAKAEHGGVIAVVKDKTLELVTKPDRLELHIHDHGKPVDISKAKATVSLQSSAGARDVVLKPAGEMLESKGTFKLSPGTKVVANVVLNGETLLARFELP